LRFSIGTDWRPGVSACCHDWPFHVSVVATGDKQDPNALSAAFQCVTQIDKKMPLAAETIETFGDLKDTRLKHSGNRKWA
jgi:hypothetical protein